MSPIKTGVKCVVCKTGNVVADVNTVSAPFSMSMPVGGESQSDQVYVSFRCQNPDCSIMYHNPPGKPKTRSKLLRKFRS